MLERTKAWSVLVLVTVVAAVLLPATRGHFKVDDSYVVANATSPQLAKRLLAWNVDRPSAIKGSWYDGVAVQRRYLRVLPSAILSIEIAALGVNCRALHLVSLGIQLVNCLLLFGLFRRWLGSDWKSALAAGVFGVHPAAAEVVGWVATQPLLVATTCALLATHAWVRYRERPQAPWLVALALATLAAAVSNESAIVLPLVLAAGDAQLTRNASLRSKERWAPRLLALGSIPVVLALSWLNARGIVAPEMSYRPSVSEVGYVARVDLENYLVKALGLMNPRDTEDYWLHNLVGEPLVVVGLLVIAAGFWWWSRRRSLVWQGVLIFGAFLAPPYLVRATFGLYNYPSLRQLYLPALGIATVVAVGLRDSKRTASLGALAMVAGYSLLSPIVGRSSLAWSDSGPGAAAARSALAGTPAGKPVVWVGSPDCAYSTGFDWPGRFEWRLVPLSRSGRVPELLRTDDHTFVALAPSGLAIPVAEVRPRRPWEEPGYQAVGRETVIPVEAVRQGRQRIEGAQIEVLSRDEGAIHALRFRLDRPVSDYVFLFAAGCDSMTAADGSALPTEASSP